MCGLLFFKVILILDRSSVSTNTDRDWSKVTIRFLLAFGRFRVKTRTSSGPTILLGDCFITLLLVIQTAFFRGFSGSSSARPHLFMLSSLGCTSFSRLDLSHQGLFLGGSLLVDDFEIRGFFMVGSFLGGSLILGGLEILLRFGSFLGGSLLLDGLGIWCFLRFGSFLGGSLLVDVLGIRFFFTVGSAIFFFRDTVVFVINVCFSFLRVLFLCTWSRELDLRIFDFVLVPLLFSAICDCE